MIHIKYSIFKNNKNFNINEIQISDHKERSFKIIYQIINQKITEKQTISLEQLVIFCSFKIIKKIKNKTNYEEIENESSKQFQKNKSYVNNFKNFKTMTIEIMVDNLPTNIIRFSA